MAELLKLLRDASLKEIRAELDRRDDEKAEAGKAKERERLAQADPKLLAEFDAERAENKAGVFCNWLDDRQEEERTKQIAAMGVSAEDKYGASYGSDAAYLARLSPETRARLLLDGKSLP